MTYCHKIGDLGCNTKLYGKRRYCSCVLLIFDGSWSLRFLGGTFLGKDDKISSYTENDKQQLYFLSSSSMALIISSKYNTHCYISMIIIIAFKCFSVIASILVIFDGYQWASLWVWSFNIF